ncbi:J-domain-containing protein [Cryobacterium sp. W22_MBD10_FK3]|uniref:DnaJ family domain-containing protein n=1 Tax=Cryobacterium sp. W22_MBD10_FK3 TaxID=3240273 RepID=UPI003F917D5E
MAGKREPSDTPLNVARYKINRETPAADRPEAAEVETNEAGQAMMDARAQYVEISIQQAMRRDDFDNLPGTGKPIPGLNAPYDPDWWIRQKIEREQITGLGPPALTLRAEDAGLDARLDAVTVEKQVREILDDFNRRVIEARRQLRGGPPVVTALRDVGAEVLRWKERREAERIEREAARQRAADALAAMTWRERRRAKRER